MVFRQPNCLYKLQIHTQVHERHFCLCVLLSQVKLSMHENTIDIFPLKLAFVPLSHIIVTALVYNFAQLWLSSNFLLNTVVSISDMPSLPSFCFHSMLFHILPLTLSSCVYSSQTFYRTKKGYSVIWLHFNVSTWPENKFQTPLVLLSRISMIYYENIFSIYSCNFPLCLLFLPNHHCLLFA